MNSNEPYLTEFVIENELVDTGFVVKTEPDTQNTQNIVESVQRFSFESGVTRKIQENGDSSMAFSSKYQENKKIKIYQIVENSYK